MDIEASKRNNPIKVRQMVRTQILNFDNSLVLHVNFSGINCRRNHGGQC